MNYNINGIIKFQRMYKFMKNEFENYNYKIVELSEVFHEMYDNLCRVNELKLFENQSSYIPLGSKHRLSNPGKIPLMLIEVQSGSYVGEDDIQRFEDKYGRISK